MSELLEIHPSELKFTFELEKQNSCKVHLVNSSDHFVAFKVKTTAPRKYKVQPSIGIVWPKSTYDFTVIMEPQKVAPDDLKCRDKFLIQSTSVSFGTTEEEITSSLFTKDNGRHIYESKLRVVLIRPSYSPVSLEMSACEALTEPMLNGVEYLLPPLMVPEDLKLLKAVELKLVQDREDEKVTKSEEESKLTRDIKALKLKFKQTESKLNEVDTTITRLRGDRRIPVISKRDKNQTEVQLGFSFLFVCLVVLMSLVIGYQLGF